jgi:Fur family transcriptional regulator, ferric uptake regulator
MEAAVRMVREQGLRLSSARRFVLETLGRARRPLTAEEIAQGFGGLPASDVASVYRNLETLERVGVVRHMHLGHGPGRYVLAGVAGHEYLVCESCGAQRVVEEAELDAVREVIRERFGFEARFSHFPLCGLCARCARRHGVGERRQPDA